jgi:hypothetical protein
MDFTVTRRRAPTYIVATVQSVVMLARTVVRCGLANRSSGMDIDALL